MRHHPSDAELVQAVLAGDTAAYGALAARYRQAAYGVALHRLDDFDSARDAAQEALVRAFVQLPTLRDPARFGAWLCRLATTTALRLRRRRRWEALPPPTADAEAAVGGEEADEIQRKQEVREALAALPEGERLAVILHYVDGYSHAEIAALTGATVPAVKSRLFRARRHLREELSPVEKTLQESVLEHFALQPLGFTVEALPWDLAAQLRITVTTVLGAAPKIAPGSHYLVLGRYVLDTPEVEWMVLAAAGRTTGYHEFLKPGRREFTLYGQVLEVVPGRESRLYLRAHPREGEECSIVKISLE